MKSRLIKILAFFSLLAAAVLLYPRFKEYRDQQGPTAVVGAPEAPAKSTEFSRAETFRQTLRYLVKNYYDTDALGPRNLLKESLFGLS
ncbi:MAG TPA: hypothetical protein VFW62_03755, partial [bacterium]|nr:hypothetical protein [bacterium]